MTQRSMPLRIKCRLYLHFSVFWQIYFVIITRSFNSICLNSICLLRFISLLSILYKRPARVRNDYPYFFDPSESKRVQSAFETQSTSEMCYCSHDLRGATYSSNSFDPNKSNSDTLVHSSI